MYSPVCLGERKKAVVIMLIGNTGARLDRSFIVPLLHEIGDGEHHLGVLNK